MASSTPSSQRVSTKRGRQPRLEVVHRNAAGIDIGSTFHVVAVPADRSSEPVRTFRSFTDDLQHLADWLQQVGITTVAMESTGVYWIPVFEILEARGLEVLLVNARQAKNVPGRKTDVNDAQWLQQLHSYGLLQASFRPRDEVVALRAYTRHRERLTQYAAAHIQHMQKALQQMNVQLHHVLSDITGQTGMAIIRATVAGERDPAVLARLRDPRCKASLETIRAALTGNYRPEHVFALQQALELYDVYQTKLAACDVQIQNVLSQLASACSEPDDPLPLAKGKGGPRVGLEVRKALYTLVGVDLTQIAGLGTESVLQLIAECGHDMSRWPTAKHFTSWLTLAPGSKISGGKVLSSRTRRSTNRAATLFRLAAMSVGRTATALGAFYRRLAARTGKAKAITATARKIATLFYNLLRYGAAYNDPGQDFYEERYRQKVLRNLERKARDLGYDLVQSPAPGG
jgi:transposase